MHSLGSLLEAFRLEARVKDYLDIAINVDQPMNVPLPLPFELYLTNRARRPPSTLQLENWDEVFPA